MITRLVRSFVAGCLTFVPGSGGLLHAHQDPRGDIHPQVVARDGKFEITFQTLLPDQVEDFSDEKPQFRMIYTADGKLFAPRHEIDRKRSHRATGPVGLYGRSQRLGDVSFYFPADQGGKPSYVMKSGDGRLTRVRLPWPETVSLSLFEEMRVVADGIAITGKQGDQVPDGGPLEFFWFPHDASTPPVSLTIGETACIYHFPVASNLAIAGGRFWLAFMRPVEDDGLDLALWSWQPGEKQARVEKLDSPAFWNSSLSLATIGDNLCLAYHWVDHEQPGLPYAKILTVFHKAE
jgi:hypothetical protein